MKKYEIVKEQSTFIDGHEVFRIRALKDIDYDIREGALGGYVESYDNLSQDGKCWLYDDSMAYANSMVFNNAKVHDRSLVNGCATVYDNASLFDNCEITDNAQVSGDAYIFDNSKISGNAHILSGAVYDHSVVSDAAIYVPDVKITGNAEILSNRDYLYLKDFGKDVGSLTIFRTSDNNVRINIDRWSGTPEEFMAVMKESYGDSDSIMKEYDLLMQLIKLHFNLS